MRQSAICVTFPGNSLTTYYIGVPTMLQKVDLRDTYDSVLIKLSDSEQSRQRVRYDTVTLLHLHIN
jgi:hypothetical protein